LAISVSSGPNISASSIATISHGDATTAAAISPAPATLVQAYCAPERDSAISAEVRVSISGRISKTLRPPTDARRS
jgi:hypothetical protein